MFRVQRVQWFVVVLIVIAIAPSIALGASMPAKIVPCTGVNCTVCNIAELAQNVLNTGIFIAVFLSAVLFAWAGFKYLSAAGSDGQVKEARGIFLNVLIGLLIILAAWLVVDALMATMTGSHLWNKIC